MHQNKLGILDDDNYNKILKYIYNFYVCYNIIGEEKSNKLEDVVYKYSKKVEEEYSIEIIKEFLSSLKEKLPNFEWFEKAFKNVGWSNHTGIYEGDKTKARVKIVLEIIEKHTSARTTIDDFTIEHILLDSEDNKNSQIGNLIPLEGTLNHRCGSKSLDQKIPIYEESNFKTARNIAKRFKDKPFNVETRTSFLAKKIYNEILDLKTFGDIK
ncbi:MAG: DUF1524 domain-containing protein [Bacteroidales bacterium]